MRKVGLIAAVVVGAAVLSASPISVNWSATQSSPTLSQNKALAAVGKSVSDRSVPLYDLPSSATGPKLFLSLRRSGVMISTSLLSAVYTKVHFPR